MGDASGGEKALPDVQKAGRMVAFAQLQQQAGGPGPAQGGVQGFQQGGADAPAACFRRDGQAQQLRRGSAAVRAGIAQQPASLLRRQP